MSPRATEPTQPTNLTRRPVLWVLWRVAGGDEKPRGRWPAALGSGGVGVDAAQIPVLLEQAQGGVEVGGLWEPAPGGGGVGVAAGELDLIGAGDPVQQPAGVIGAGVIVLDGPSELKVLTDRRVDAFAQAEQSAIREHPIVSPAHRARVDELVAAQRRHRNQPGGYWVAGAKPAAAYEAVAGSLPRSFITRAALLSDGVSCLVERYGAGDWSWLLTVLQDEGPGRLIARARELEGCDPTGARWPRYKASDDATAAICLPS
jgi:hypothetical protein